MHSVSPQELCIDHFQIPAIQSVCPQILHKLLFQMLLGICSPLRGSSAKFGQTGAAEGLSLSDSPFLESPDHAKKFSFLVPELFQRLLKSQAFAEGLD